MNQIYINHEAYEWEDSYAYSSIVGGFLHLQVGIISLPQFLGGKLMDIRWPPHTLQIFSECFMLWQISYPTNMLKNMFRGLYM